MRPKVCIHTTRLSLQLVSAKTGGGLGGQIHLVAGSTDGQCHPQSCPAQLKTLVLCTGDMVVDVSHCMQPVSAKIGGELGGRSI